MISRRADVAYSAELRGGLNAEQTLATWVAITDGEFAGDYILAWEDLRFLGDRDYNDLVVRVSGVSHMAVPVPAAVWLFGSGLLGLLTIARRRV